MENADTYDAPRPPGDAGPEPTGAETPHDESRHMLDGLFDGHDSSKEAILSFITTGKPPKDGVAPLRDLFVALSALPTPDLEKSHASSGPTSNIANHEAGKEGKDNDNDDVHKDALSPGSLPSIPLPQPLSPTTTPQAALPPTPKPDENTAGGAYDEFGGEPDLRAFFIGLLASGKVAPDKVKQLFDISTLAAGEDFTALMEHGRQHSGYGFQHRSPYSHLQFAQGGILQSFQAPPSSRWKLQGPSQPQRQPTPNSQSFQQPTAPFEPHDVAHASSTFEAILALDAGSYPSAMSPGLDQQQSVMNSYIAPTAPANQPPPPPTPVDGSYNPVSLLANVPLDPSSHDLAAAANFERQNALPSPVVTQASSNTPEGSTTPGAADPFEVICPLRTPDGNVCGKRCQGAKPYRSIQEHIRRAHPGRYMPGLPATEESFRAMVDSEGVTCPMNKPDGSACDFRVTGSKPYRCMHEHVKEEHPDRFISGLPANEASFRISE